MGRILRVFAGEMAGTTGEIARLEAFLAGEMTVDDIPVSPNINLDELKEGDPDPVQVVVGVPLGKSSKGWNYLRQALDPFVSAIMEGVGLPGYKGHMKPEEVATKFLDPATHWIGAKVVEDYPMKNPKTGRVEKRTVYFFRGLIDQAEERLKRLIKKKRITAPSIFGQFTLARATSGEINVVGAVPISIDWAPLGRNGMDAFVAAVGEMDSTINPGDPNKPTERRDDPVTWKEALAALIAALKSQETTIQAVAGEMIAAGVKAEDIITAINADLVKENAANVKLLGELREALGVSGEMAPAEFVNRAKEAGKALAGQATQAHDALVTKILREGHGEQKLGMVAGEMAQAMVRRMLKCAPGSTAEVIAGEIEELKKSDELKEFLSSYYQDRLGGRPPVPGRTDQGRTGTTTKKVRF